LRRYIPAAAAAAIFLVGGCTGSADTDSPGGESQKTPAASTSSQQADATQPPVLEVPKNAEVLVTETTGTGNKNLREFTPSEEAYTVYASCSGKGKVTIIDRDGRGEPHLVACDGVRTVGVIHTETKPQHLTIQVTDGTSNWKVAVVSGSHEL
jgi:hypothetical protein